MKMVVEWTRGHGSGSSNKVTVKTSVERRVSPLFCIMASISLLLCYVSFSHCAFVDRAAVNAIGAHWPQLEWGVANATDCPSEFVGLTCSSDLNGTHVSILRLSNLSLTGSILPQIGNFYNLRYLYLDNNQLTGSIPPQLSNLIQLRQMYLSNNQLSGSIPPQLGNLVNMGTFLSSNNFLSGTIPPQFGNLTSLKLLYLSNNSLTGTIPPQIGNMAALSILLLYSNHLTGTIPPQLGNLVNLTIVQLQNNRLTGSIPPELGLENISWLLLNDNLLTGTIPPQLGGLANLTILQLNNNQLTGFIPPEFDMTNLVLFILSDNQLTGSIPPQLGNLPNLYAVWLFNNQLTGSIPPQLGNPIYIVQLRLSNNQLTGTIPPQLGSLVNLTIFETQCNQFLDICATSINKSFNHGNCTVDTVNPTTGCKTNLAENGCSFHDTTTCPLYVPPPSTCITDPPQPPDLFRCIGGQWVSNRSVEVPNIEISGPTIIQGNLTINNTITFNGPGSAVNVSGCISLGDGGIVLNLSDEEIEGLSKNGESNRLKQLLQNSSCSNDLSTTSIQTNTPKSCKRVSTSTSDVSTPSLLSVVFKVDSSRCNLWWIILASVLGGIILIVIILVLLFRFNDTLRKKAIPGRAV